MRIVIAIGLIWIGFICLFPPRYGAMTGDNYYPTPRIFLFSPDAYLSDAQPLQNNAGRLLAECLLVAVAVGIILMALFGITRHKKPGIWPLPPPYPEPPSPWRPGA
jgi:hypothetical protein